MKKKIEYKFSLENFITVFFFIFIIFYGKIPFQSYNSPYWKIQVLFYLFSPSLLYVYLINISKNRYFIFKTNNQNIILGLSFFIISILLFLNDPYLKYDELFFANMSFKLVEKFIENFNNFFESTLFNNIKLKHLYQFLSLLFWLILLSTIVKVIRVKNQNKRLLIIFFLLFFLRTLTLLMKFQIGVHAPLNYFLPNVLCTIFGINDLTFKIGSHLAFSITFFHIINRIKLKFKVKLLFCLCILTIPQIGNSSFLFEQGNYFYLFAILVLFEVSFIKPRPFILAIIVSISILFRYTNIILLIPYIFYSFQYYKDKYSFKASLQKVLYDSIYLLISFPAFYQIFFLGTTSTEPINFYLKSDSIADVLLNIELLIFSIDSYNYYIILVLLILVFIIFNKDFFIFTNIIIVSVSYLILKNIVTKSDFTSNLDSRYQFEFFGFIIFFTIVYLFYKLNNFKKFYYYLLIILIAISFYQPYNKPNYQNIPTYYLKNNSYLFDYIKSNKILKNTLIYTLSLIHI